MSGSFANSWDGRAHSLLMRLLDELFAAGMGNESRVVIGQLSGSGQVVLFEGTPTELRQKFKSPEDLMEFLRANADPTGSKVFESTQSIIDYAGAINGVNEQTKLVVAVLSDLVDSEKDTDVRAKAEEQMIESLTRHRKRNGGLALYYVSPDQASTWRQIMADAGFEPGQFVIETELSESPQLPQLD